MFEPHDFVLELNRHGGQITIELFFVVLKCYFTLRYQVYIVVVWNFQLFMLPLVLLLIFIKNLLVVQVGDAILKEKKPDVRIQRSEECHLKYFINHNDCLACEVLNFFLI